MTDQEVRTSAVTFVEADHGRMRRAQRAIHKKDLQAAKKYGVWEETHPRPNGDATSKYTYKNIVYIANDVTGEEVTSYTLPITLKCVPVSREMQKAHNDAQRSIKRNLDMWKSNTVLVVDTSGSMKAGDLWGARTRLDAVWIAVALDFVAQRLETGDAGFYDVISVVTLGPTAQIVYEEQPTSWVFYNKIVELYMQKPVTPRGHGLYIPSLELAEKLLYRNSNASCALSILFLSDGRPSDHMTLRMEPPLAMQEVTKHVETLASQFGRRLTFSAIGMGKSDDFEMLQMMVDAANDYGAIGSFHLPSLTTSDLGNAFSSVASSITTTQSELTELGTQTQRKVRNIKRESRLKARESTLFVRRCDYSIYNPSSVYRTVYREVKRDGQKGLYKAFEKVPLQHPNATHVAIKNEAFGEGAERYAFRFFELAADGATVVGDPLVAKESRFLLDENLGSEGSRRKFVQTFCSTQQLAKRIAAEFNAKLDSMRRVDNSTPRVAFLDCSIYHLTDHNLGELSVLVEPCLNHLKWKKWNSNNGYVDGMVDKSPKVSEEDMRKVEQQLRSMTLDMIEEGSEDEESDGEENDHITAVRRRPSVVPQLSFSPSEVAQAFSHFSYWATGRKRLICDLQGEYDKDENVLKLSDPVIHYYNHRQEHRKHVHGRTDLSDKGIQLFFATHKCSKLCHLVTRGFKEVSERRKKVGASS